MSNACGSFSRSVEQCAPMHALDVDDRVCQVHALRSSLPMSWSVEDMLATIVYALTLALTLTPSPTHAHPRHVTVCTHMPSCKTLIVTYLSCTHASHWISSPTCHHVAQLHGHAASVGANISRTLRSAAHVARLASHLAPAPSVRHIVTMAASASGDSTEMVWTPPPKVEDL